MADRSYTAKIGLHRQTVFSLYFGPNCEIMIDRIGEIDFARLRADIAAGSDIITAGTMTVDLKYRVVTFPGILLSPGRWMAGGVADAALAEAASVSVPATREEILYVLWVMVHMFGGEEPVRCD
jgi:hypothetical protein